MKKSSLVGRMLFSMKLLVCTHFSSFVLLIFTSLYIIDTHVVQVAQTKSWLLGPRAKMHCRKKKMRSIIF
jgi:hypothetical protein